MAEIALQVTQSGVAVRHISSTKTATPQYGQLNRTMRATAQATANAHHAERASSRKQKTACRTATVPEGQEAQQERLGSLVRRLGGAVVYKAVGRPGVKPKPVLRPLCPCGLPHSLTCRRRAECALQIAFNRFRAWQRLAPYGNLACSEGRFIVRGGFVACRTNDRQLAALS